MEIDKSTAPVAMPIVVPFFLGWVLFVCCCCFFLLGVSLYPIFDIGRWKSINHRPIINRFLLLFFFISIGAVDWRWKRDEKKFERNFLKWKIKENPIHERPSAETSATVHRRSICRWTWDMDRWDPLIKKAWLIKKKVLIESMTTSFIDSGGVRVCN